MAVSTIDGTLESAVLKRVRGKVRVYERLTFKLADGSAKSIAKAIVHQDVAAALVPGTTGRFYLFTTIDQRGVHGVRDDKGHSVFAYSKMNETAMLWTTGISVLLVLIWLLQDKLSILGVILFVLSIPGYFLYRKVRLEAERQFQADN
jgi:hypothetical protein